MTKEAALYQFFSGFGIPAYAATSVPEDTIFPWLTYELQTGAFDSGEMNLTVDLWYRTEAEADPNAKAREISQAIGMGGKVLPCDGGYIWVKRGSPWSISLRDDIDQHIKRRQLNVTVEYLTKD